MRVPYQTFFDVCKKMHDLFSDAILDEFVKKSVRNMFSKNRDVQPWKDETLCSPVAPSQEDGRTPEQASGPVTPPNLEEYLEPLQFRPYPGRLPQQWGGAREPQRDLEADLEQRKTTRENVLGTSTFHIKLAPNMTWLPGSRRTCPRAPDAPVARGD